MPRIYCHLLLFSLVVQLSSLSTMHKYPIISIIVTYSLLLNHLSHPLSPISIIYIVMTLLPLIVQPCFSSVTP